MKIGEAISTGVLLFGGIFVLKALGGVEGLSNLFSGLGGLLGGGAPTTPAQTPQDILTQTDELASQYELLTVPQQQLAQDLQTIATQQQQLNTTPLPPQPADPLMTMFGPLGWIGNWLTGGDTIQDVAQGTIDTATSQAVADYYASAGDNNVNQQQQQAQQHTPTVTQTHAPYSYTPQNVEAGIIPAPTVVLPSDNFTGQQIFNILTGN